MTLLKAGALLAISALLVAGVACGGDDDDGDDANRTTTASASGSAGPGRSGSPGPNGSGDEPGESSTPGSPGASPSGDGGSSGGGGGGGGADGGGEDGEPTPTPDFDIVTPISQTEFEPAEGEYCDTVSATSPPNSVIGLLKIDGADVAAGTEVTVAFDGVPGPMEATREAGGYRVDFGIATTGDCANKAGAMVSIVVNGIEYESGREAGSAAAIRFDITE